MWQAAHNETRVYRRRSDHHLTAGSSEPALSDCRLLRLQRCQSTDSPQTAEVPVYRLSSDCRGASLQTPQTAEVPGYRLSSDCRGASLQTLQTQRCQSADSSDHAEVPSARPERSARCSAECSGGERCAECSAGEPGRTGAQSVSGERGRESAALARKRRAAPPAADGLNWLPLPADRMDVRYRRGSQRTASTGLRPPDRELRPPTARPRAHRSGQWSQAGPVRSPRRRKLPALPRAAALSSRQVDE